MAFKVFNRIKQTVTGSGTVSVTLGAAIAGYRGVGDRYSNGDTLPYLIEQGNDWEIGVGSYNSAGGTLTRSTVHESSNNDLAVNFAAGDKTLSVVALAKFDVQTYNWMRTIENTNAAVGAENTAPTLQGDGLMAFGPGAFVSGEGSVAIGIEASCIGNYAFTLSYMSYANGNYASAFGGQQNTALGTHSIAGGGQYNYLGVKFSSAVGGRNADTDALPWPGVRVLGSGIYDEGTWSVQPYVEVALCGFTADATPIDLAFDGDAATNPLKLIDASDYERAGYALTVDVLAVASNGDVKRWTIPVTFKHSGTGTAAFVDGTPSATVVHDDAGASAWTLTVALATTPDRLRIIATGEAGRSIEWQAVVRGLVLGSWLA